MDIIITLLFVGTLFILYAILKEIRFIRVLQEMPSDMRKSIDDELNKLDKEITVMQGAMEITRIEEGQFVSGVALVELLKRRKGIMEKRRNNIFVYPRPDWEKIDYSIK